MLKKKALPIFLAIILNPHFNYLVFKLLVAIYILMALIFEWKFFVCIKVSKSKKRIKNHKLLWQTSFSFKTFHVMKKYVTVLSEVLN